jgi:serine/threonine protein kinase
VVRHLQQEATWPDLSGLKYVVLEELGRGGMGIVYRAHDEELDREVALKVSNAIVPRDAPESRLSREARVLATLEHPGIVPIHDAGVLRDGRAFYVMKLVNGELLTRHLAGLDSIDARLRLFERICEPVAFAHARGIVHRDLKPDNIMVGAFGEVLVLDWGLARRFGPPEAATSPRAGARLRGIGGQGPTTTAGIVAGTPGFMAPEQRRADAEIDATADVYALGGILFAILTDETPPDCASLASALARRSGIPRRLRAICLKAMAEASEERYPDAAALGEDVGRFRSGLAVDAYRESLFERAGRFAAAYRTPILLVAAYLIMRALVAWYLAVRS